MFLHYSMTASPTATNLATPSSSGPKVTARGRSRPTYYQPHRFKNVACPGRWTSAAQALFTIIPSRFSNHRHREMLCNLSCFCCTFFCLPNNDPPLPLDNPAPSAVPRGFSRREHWRCGQLHLWQGAQYRDPALSLSVLPQPHPSLPHYTEHRPQYYP